MQGRWAALWMAAALLLAAPACAQEMPASAYGGSGEDALLEAVGCENGLFAVGTTASSDYDLSMRKRTGESGWALCLGPKGETRFSYCTSHTGMVRMTAPAALSDGGFALVLTDEAEQRGEWIVLNEQGEAVVRVPIEGAAALCPQGVSIEQMLTVEGANGAQVAALVRTQDGGVCCVRIAQDGRMEAGEAVFLPEGTIFCGGGAGEMAYAAAQNGALYVGEMYGGQIQADNLTAQAVCDIQMDSDGSVAVCGETMDGGGFLLRVSREGETLFAMETGAPLRRLTATDAGYAALENGRILFTDEDGVEMGWADAPENVVDLAPSVGGAAALCHDPMRGRRQAIFAHVAQPALAPRSAQEQTGARWTALEDGYLLCSDEDGKGVQVRCMNAGGEEMFSVRTPIHTAADGLEWLCALKRSDGAVLLGGRYLYAEGRQEGVTALLSADGVLLRMETITGTAAVCGAQHMPDGGILLHTASKAAEHPEADGVLTCAW